MESPFDNIVNCCGCGACASACTHKAISLIANAQGFVYPVIDKDKCIDCGLCEKVCPVLQQDKPRNPVIVYAAKNSNLST